IFHDLEQSLLFRTAESSTRCPASHQALPRQSQNRIVVRCRPLEINLFSAPLQFFVLSQDRADPKPGENHVDRQIGNTRRPDQTLWLGKMNRTKGPMP